LLAVAAAASKLTLKLLLCVAALMYGVLAKPQDQALQICGFCCYGSMHSRTACIAVPGHSKVGH